MASAPLTTSSAGWPISITVPCHLLFNSDSTFAVPRSVVMWMSCPQACITPALWLTYATPVCSVTGSASMSLRTSTVGPAPFFITATTP